MGMILLYPTHTLPIAIGKENRSAKEREVAGTDR
jgi:hypothetical protein